MALVGLAQDRASGAVEWSAVARTWQLCIGGRIAEFQQFKDRFTGCIGCGCLSLRTCTVCNSGDIAFANGAGACYLLGGDLATGEG